jgi:membrane dipeptidase
MDRKAESPAYNDAQIDLSTGQTYENDTRTSVRKRYDRSKFRLTMLVLLACLGINLINMFHLQPFAWLRSLSHEKDPVKAVLAGAPLIDTHNDFPIWIRAFYKNDIYQPGFTNTSKIYGMVDFPRLREGGVRGQFWSVYVDCPKDSGNYSDEAYLPLVKETLQQIDLVNRLQVKFPYNLQVASTSKDIWHQFHHSKEPVISSLMGAEGLHQIANSASILRLYHTLGVRYITLTHSCHNIYADSCGPDQPLHNGLSVAGVAMVQEMNRIGMMVDLSHVSPATMRNALNVTRAPVIFSHSSAYSLCNHPRNVPDDILKLVKKNGGVVQVTFVPEFIKCDIPSEATLSDVADHIEHIGKLIGYEHVGLGSDFDGIPYGPKGLEDVSKYPDLIKELLDRGVSVKELQGVVGGNLLRVMKQVEKVSTSMIDVEPLQDEVGDVFSMTRMVEKHF